MSELMLDVDQLKAAPIVQVDHSVRPVYPDWVKAGFIDTPEFVALERMGPAEFDVSRLRKWWHPKQKRSVVWGTVIQTSLIKKKILPSCLGYADLLAIKTKGAEFFQQHFKNLAVFGWRSVVPDRGGDLSVPYLVAHGGEVALDWYWLDGDWDASDPALRFAS